jgi:hypothetical protein
VARPIKPEQLERLHVALRALEGPACQDRNPRSLIAHLKAHFEAKVELRPTGNVIYCAGVRANCTWSEDDGLLSAWMRLARRRVCLADQQISATPPSPVGRTVPGTAQSGPGAPQPIGEVHHG